MANHQEERDKLANAQLNKLKYAAKNKFNNIINTCLIGLKIILFCS